MRLPLFASLSRRGVQVQVWVTPGARSDGVDGVLVDADGGVRLKVMVTAVADRGRANAAVMALLARAWAVPKSALAITAGVSSRRKVVALAGDQDVIAERLAVWASSRRLM